MTASRQSNFGAWLMTLFTLPFWTLSVTLQLRGVNILRIASEDIINGQMLTPDRKETTGKGGIGFLGRGEETGLDWN